MQDHDIPFIPAEVLKTTLKTLELVIMDDKQLLSKLKTILYFHGVRSPGPFFAYVIILQTIHDEFKTFTNQTGLYCCNRSTSILLTVN